MKSFPHQAAASILALAATGPAWADIQNHAAVGVNKVVFNLPGALSIQPGDKETLIVEAEAKVLPKLDIKINAGTLTLSSKEGFKTDKPLKFTLTIKSLRSLNSAGSGNSTVTGFQVGDLEALASGSGNIALQNVKLNKVHLSIPGSGNIEASGAAEQVNASIAGSGTIKSESFKVKNAEAKIAGSGNISVNASDNLKASIEGSGNIEYKGKPRLVKQISGAGNIEPL